MSNEQRKQQIWDEACHRYADSKMRNAFVTAVEWADSHPRWIPVEEELPKRMNENSRFSDTVLVYNKDGYKDTAYYDFQEKIWRWMPSITHWMEIVPPRKEE